MQKLAYVHKQYLFPNDSKPAADQETMKLVGDFSWSWSVFWRFDTAGWITKNDIWTVKTPLPHVSKGSLPEQLEEEEQGIS